jgi:hypothetical protein
MVVKMLSFEVSLVLLDLVSRCGRFEVRATGRKVLHLQL